MIRIMEYGEVPDEEIFARKTAAADTAEIVAAILADAKGKGDCPLDAECRNYDGCGAELLRSHGKGEASGRGGEAPEFSPHPPGAADNIRSFHKRQCVKGFLFQRKRRRHPGQKITRRLKR